MNAEKTKAETTKAGTTKKRIFIALITLFMSALHIFIVSGRDRVTFQWPDKPGLTLYALLILFALFTYAFYLSVIRSIILIHRRDAVFLRRFKFFLGYLLFTGIFFLLTWPGIYKGDEFYVLRSALSFTLSGAQSGLTSVFYIVTLLFFPSMAAIVFIQLLIICSIFARVLSDLFSVIESKVRYILFLPFILLPVIDADLFTLRASLVGWIFLLLLDIIFMLDKRGDKVDNRKAVLIMSLLAGIECAWRSEYLYLIIFLPLMLLWLKKVKLKQAAVTAVLICLCWQLFSVPNKVALNGENRYPISLVLNPIANMFTEEDKLKGPSLYEDVMTINELVDVKRLRLDATVVNISQYWNIPEVLPRVMLSRFMKAALRIIAYNPGMFLKYRWQTFLYTCGFVPDLVNHPGGEDVNALMYLQYYGRDYASYFAFSKPPLGWSLRAKVISFLACRTYGPDNEIKTGFWLPVFYNVLWPLILSILSFIAAVVKKKKETACLIVLTLLQFPLIFLTAPAMFFMYYFCLYLCCYVLSALTLAMCLSEKKSKK